MPGPLSVTVIRKRDAWLAGGGAPFSPTISSFTSTSGRMPPSSHASSALSTASLTQVSSALRGLSKPSRCRFFVKNSETEISRCRAPISTAVICCCDGGFFWTDCSGAVGRGSVTGAGVCFFDIQPRGDVSSASWYHKNRREATAILRPARGDVRSRELSECGRRKDTLVCLTVHREKPIVSPVGGVNAQR